MANYFSIYIHWPFCEKKCPYCDFNSHVSKQEINYDDWLTAYKKELLFYKSITSYTHVKSIFLGGGTPSLMPVSLIEKLLIFISDTWAANDNIEITMEANPNSVEASKFEDLASVGVNRVSIGVQSFKNQNLLFLGRTHGRKEAIKAIASAKKFFKEYSFDLIYALPNQTIADLKVELKEASYYLSTHISCYQLTIEPNTAFASLYRLGALKPLSDDRSAQMYLVVSEFLEKHNISRYEVSNYAKLGHESYHNLNYCVMAIMLASGQEPMAELLLIILKKVMKTQFFKFQCDSQS